MIRAFLLTFEVFQTSKVYILITAKTRRTLRDFKEREEI